MKNNISPPTETLHAVVLLAIAMIISLGFRGAVQAQNLINVNFRGGSGPEVSGVAGAVPSAQWNNYAGSKSLSPQVALDDLGQDRGVTISFSGSRGINYPNPGTSPDADLFEGQVLTLQGGSGVLIQIAGIPFPQYEVIIYFGSNTSQEGASLSVETSGQYLYGLNQDVSALEDPIVYTFAEATDSANASPANAARFVDLVGHDRSIMISGIGGNTGVCGLQIVNQFKDSDGDGLDDDWEEQYFGDLDENGSGDPDQDGLENKKEFDRGTDPSLADSDLDGLPDGVESGTGEFINQTDTGTSPILPDTDNDGLNDGVETNSGLFQEESDTGTHPLLQDSDNDRVQDGQEVRRGFDPNNPDSTPSMPNIVFILADDLGYNEVGAYGQTKILTPNIDSLAAEGMRFTQHYSGSPVCAPSRCVFLSGLHTGHSYIRNNYETGGYQLAIPDDTFTIGEMLQQAGYKTGIIGKWGLGGPDTEGHPNDQGFDHFFGYLGQVQAHWHYPPQLWRNKTQVYYPGNSNDTGNVHSQDEFAREAKEFISDNQDNPFFLYLAFIIPHVSLQVPQETIDTFYGDVDWPETPYGGNGHYTGHPTPRRAYAGMITHMDQAIGQIMDHLKNLGLDDNTLIVFTSDNGTTTCCGVDYRFFNSLGDLRGSKGNAYEGGIRVPFIARWPGKIEAGATSDHISAFWDFMPTFADILDIPAPPNTDGISMLPTLLGHPERQEEHEYLYWEHKNGGTWLRAVRMGPWKGVRSGANGTLQLFNLDQDISESRNVAAANPGIVEQIEVIMAGRHIVSENFFRGDDEFPVSSLVSLSSSNLGYRLDNSQTRDGYVLTHLLQPVDEPASFHVRMQHQTAAGRLYNGGILLGSGNDPGQFVFADVDLSGQKLILSYQGQSEGVALPPGLSPDQVIDLEVYYLPAQSRMTAIVGGTFVNLALPKSFPGVADAGFQLRQARTNFSPITIVLDRPALDSRIHPAIQGNRFILEYERGAEETGSPFLYQRNHDWSGWDTATPAVEQVRKQFGSREKVEAEFIIRNEPAAFYRVQFRP